ncbi:unnamed protein product [Medioppia subpectinata]|uniref:UDP-glycosyltransferase n=1 Tax=Medioppia subpectinata TaxID=1979941 RepID=A0A7R9KU68_9ACAR|nr:unnamed protein product [Medioppia subpectinata]CAG2109767.1 unnamed protein product [Medioppia subpectinata]
MFQQMVRKLTILFAPVEGVGHVNACIGLAEVLLSRGHKIVFAIDQSFAGRLAPYGFIEEVFPSHQKDQMPGEMFANHLLDSGLLSNVSSFESLKIWRDIPVMDVVFAKKRANEPTLKTIVAKHSPDLFVIDDFNPSPAVLHSNKPWVCVISANLLFTSTDNRLPPGWSGFPANSDTNKWKEFREEFDKTFVKQSLKYNEWLEEEGLPTVNVNKIHITSPYLNIYGYPEELDYTDIRPIPEKWLRVDTFMRRGEKQEFKIPDKFIDRDIEKSKLIYLSMGSMGSINVDLMKRLVSILSKSQHKFIVSKGLFGDTYELADNMWGENSVPQTKVLPLVDVVITHGGNNSVTETFSCAKHNPDVYIIDDFIGSPALIHSTKPWVFLFSGNPLFVLRDDRTPPECSGYPSNGDRQEWQEFRELSNNMFKKQSIKYNEWMKEEGFPVNNENNTLPNSPFLNMYGFPEELDYTDLRPLPEKWLRVDTFMRKGEKQEFQIPDKFRDRDIEKSKLIYLSLGSMGSANVDLMKRLVSILSKSQHKIIVSKGLFGDTYELADNMWGENSVPQTKVLPLVDVVITHGGNNSVTETFSCGKPMIIMPLCGDQYDNAQRVHEKGFGIRLNPHNCSEQELLDSIDKLLNDKELKHKLSVALKQLKPIYMIVAQKFRSKRSLVLVSKQRDRTPTPHKRVSEGTANA